MKKNFPSVYVPILFASMLKTLDGFTQKKDPEQIHNLRVDIKKLRAIFSFFNKTSGKKTFPKKALANLFKQAATIRDVDVNITLLEKFPGSKKLLSDLKKKNPVPGFVSKIPAHKKTIRALKNRTKVSHELPGDQKIRKYFNKQIKKAQKELDKKDEENAHHFRTRIKQMMYIYDALPKKIRKSLGINKKYIDQLQESAGKWHDHFSATQYFKKIRSPKDQYAELEKIEKKQFKLFISDSKNFKKHVYL
jgi:CHAD domain-containing protein